MGDLAPLAVAGPGDHLAVDSGGQVIRGAKIITVVVGVQLALFVQQGRGAGLNTLDNNAQTGLITVHIAVIQAVDLVLHQGAEGLAGEVTTNRLTTVLVFFTSLPVGLSWLPLPFPLLPLLPVFPLP